MILSKITVHNFRNFTDKQFIFSPQLTIIFGENTRGKTNLLEAIFCLTHGQGFRETREEELIKFGTQTTEIVARFDGEDWFDLRMRLRKLKQGIEKIFLVNKTKKRWIEYQSQTVRTVLFSPQQLQIITGPPDERRQYFDKLISAHDPTYKKKLNNYNNALRKRNKILEFYRSDDQLSQELFFWDDYLEQQAEYITQKRRAYSDFLNRHPDLNNKKFSVVYLVNELTKARLAKVHSQEKKYRRTLIGPQKDDFQIDVADDKSKKNLHLFGSRSEHRLGIFWLKLNEIRHFEEIAGKKPILLLDDIFSELDRKNKKLVLDLIKKYQTILTTTEQEVIDLTIVPKIVIEL